MRSPLLLAMMALLLPFNGLAQSDWRNADGTPMAQRSASAAARGFSASLVVTDNPQWRAIWDATTGDQPRFEAAQDVRNGGELYIVAFLSNPLPGADGTSNVRCDVRVNRPDGSATMDQRGLPCFQGRPGADPGLIYLSSEGVRFLAEATDPRGTWTVRITLTDANRGVALPLQATFNVR